MSNLLQGQPDKESDEIRKIDSIVVTSTTNTITNGSMKNTKSSSSCPNSAPTHDDNVDTRTAISEDDDPLSVKGTSASRKGRERARNGMKWVKLNYREIEQLKRDPNAPERVKLALTTSPFPNSDKWSLDYLPEILFYLKPPESKYERQPVELLKENGKVVVNEDGKELRAFPILPRRISVEVQGWLVEAWRRLDPRITYTDILDRQTECPERKLVKPDKNALSNRCNRECRKVLGSWTSYDKRDVPHRTDVEAIEKLSYQNILLNTVLDICPGRQDRLNRIRMVRRSEDEWGKLYVEPWEFDATDMYRKTFPLDHFILKSEVPRDGLHSMDDIMMASWELSLILQERARLHKQYSWATLPDRCKPASWYDRTGGGKRTPNDTFDGGCPVCTWVPGRDQLLHKEWIDEVRSACSKPANRKPAAKKGASSGSSKRRKLDDGIGQNTSLHAAEDVDKECECCKETDAVSESASAYREYPSQQFLRGEIKSYFRDPDHIEEALVGDVFGSTEEHSTAHHNKRDSVTVHRPEHFDDLESGDKGVAEDWELRLWAPVPQGSHPSLGDDNDISGPEKDNHWRSLEKTWSNLWADPLDAAAKRSLSEVKKERDYWKSISQGDFA